MTYNSQTYSVLLLPRDHTKRSLPTPTTADYEIPMPGHALSARRDGIKRELVAGIQKSGRCWDLFPSKRLHNIHQTMASNAIDRQHRPKRNGLRCCPTPWFGWIHTNDGAIEEMI